MVLSDRVAEVDEEATVVRRGEIQQRAWGILESGGTKSAQEIADRMIADGYKPAATKSSSQLRRSVWVALSRDDRVRRVAPGKFAAK